MICCQHRLSLPCAPGPHLGSLAQSAPGTDLRPLPNSFAAVRSLLPALELTHRQQHPHAHIQLNFLVYFKSFGRSAIPLYNPHRTR